MALNLGCYCFSPSSLPHSPYLTKTSGKTPNETLLSLLLSTFVYKDANFSSSRRRRRRRRRPFKIGASLGESRQNVDVVDDKDRYSSVSDLLDEDWLARASASKDAGEALDIISEMSGRNSGVVRVSDCCLLISSAIRRNNAELALSVFYAMRSSFDDRGVGSENGPLVQRWKWSRPDASVYTVLIIGLASSLKVSDALRMIDYICRVGVSPSEEVPFGKVVKCPICMIAVAVAQPQQGIQVASCAKCRYQYELVSGDITSINSEEIRINLCMLLILGH